jgi:hypothetical protein
MKMMRLDLLAPYQGALRDELALRREKRWRLEDEHRGKNRAT